MNQLLQEQYERLGISPEVSAFGEKIEASLKQRFEEIDARAEYNQPYQLSAAVLGRLGITTGLMTAFQQTCREEPTYRADLRMLQYDALYGKGYCYEGEARYRPTEMEMGMVPIEITGMEQRAGDWFILGENFTPYCVVTQNGQLLDTEYEAPWLLRVTEEPNTADYRDLEISVVDKHNEVLSNTE